MALDTKTFSNMNSSNAIKGWSKSFTAGQNMKAGLPVEEQIATLKQQVAELQSGLSALIDIVVLECVRQSSNGALQFPAPGKVEISNMGTSVRIDVNGFKVSSSADIDLQCPAGRLTLSNGKAVLQSSTIELSAGVLNANCATAKFSGMVQCQTLQATSVIGSSYTPGAGNIW